MKILIINKFLYPKGGDAIAALQTGTLLETKGHDVFFWGMDHPLNPEYKYRDLFVSHIDFNSTLPLGQKIKLIGNILYSMEAKNKIKKLFSIERPDLIHLNNFAHQISPSIVDAADSCGIPMVMTFHDYKMVCPSYSMLNHGKNCELCRHGRYYNCFLKKCFKDSIIISLAATLEMYLHHKILHIYDKIKLFISPSRFLKNKLEELGFPGKIVYLPNFIKVEEYHPKFDSQEKSIAYLGRLSSEKGLFTLLNAVKGLDIELKLFGAGHLKKELEQKAKTQNINNIKFLGYLTGNKLQNEIKKVMFVVLPSECYENNPLAVMEAFALGKPVVGARIGGIPELVKDGLTGWTFHPGNADDLREKIILLAHSGKQIAEMGRHARALVQNQFNAVKYYEKLIKIYKDILKENL